MACHEFRRSRYQGLLHLQSIQRDQPAMTKTHIREFYQRDFNIVGIRDRTLPDEKIIRTMQSFGGSWVAWDMCDEDESPQISQQHLSSMSGARDQDTNGFLYGKQARQIITVRRSKTNGGREVTGRRFDG
jgi:hypothetical protein